MTTPLTNTQTDDLQAILDNSSLSKSERAADYYLALQSYGYSYGAIGYAVSTDSGLTGTTANKFLENYAEKNSITLSSTDIEDIRYNLASEDLTARVSKSGADLTGSEIRDYHGSVYSSKGLTLDAWAANVPFNVLGETGWNTILNNPDLGNTAISVEMLALSLKDFSTYTQDDDTDGIAILDWYGDIFNAAAAASVKPREIAGEAVFNAIVNQIILGKNLINSATDPIISAANSSAISALFNALGQAGLFPVDGVETALGVFANAIANLTAPRLTDPIVLDLSGTGIELTSIDDSDAYFDLHDTGFAVHTGWVGPNTGILVTPNLDGSVTDITNLFGNSSTDGFTAMSAIDSNADGILDSNDTAFGDLRVWIDSNGDGQVDSGELKTLGDLDIVSINLDPTPTTQTVNGNVIAALAHYTRGDSTTGQVAEAFFNNNQLASTYTGSYTLNPEVLALPNQRGYGTMPDLFIAMSLDSTLLGMVQDLTETTDFTDMNDQITVILYRWAGVSSVSSTGRGTLVDGQHLAVLEKVIGHAWENDSSSSNPTSIRQAAALEKAYTLFFESVKNHLLVQGPLASYFDGLTYNYATDSLTGTTDYADAVTAFDAGTPTTTLRAKGEYWIDAIKLLDSVASENSVSINSYDTALQDVLASAGLPSTLPAIHNLHFINSTPDGLGNNVFEVDNNTIRGAIIEGLSTGTNVLNGVYDLADAVFTNMNTLQIPGGELMINASQLASFTDLVSTSPSGFTTIYATSGGTYDLSSLNLTGGVSFNSRYATGPVTFIAPSSDTSFVDGVNYQPGVEITMLGGVGDDSFTLNHAINGSTLTGGDGRDTIQFGLSEVADISGLNISGIEVMNATRSLMLTADQLTDFDTINTYGQSSIHAASAGTYDFSTKTVDGYMTITGQDTSDNVTFIANDQGALMLDGAGVSTFVGGAGDDTFSITQATAGGSISGGEGYDTLFLSANDISGLAISGVENLYLNGDVRLTAAQLSSFSSLTGYGYGYMYAASAGTYDLTAISAPNTLRMSAGSTSSDVIFKARSGDVTFIDGAGNNTFVGGGGSNTYYMGSAGGQDIIDNNASGGVASGYVNLGSYYNNQLWLEQAGNDLKIDIMGTTNTLTVKDWFGSDEGAQTDQIWAAYSTLNHSNVSALVSAMASFANSNPSFDPTLVGEMPSDTTLQTAITANWQ